MKISAATCSTSWNTPNPDRYAGQRIFVVQRASLLHKYATGRLKEI